MTDRRLRLLGSTRLPTRSRVPVVAAATCALLLSGCATGESPSTTVTSGPTAARIATLWWIMFGLAVFVCVLVAALFGLAILRRRRRAASPDEEPRWSLRMLLVGGLIFPVVVLSFLWVLTLIDLRADSAPASPARLTVQVIGHRWWWEIRYPQQHIETANELHIPVGEPVDVVLNSFDVQHSFWVPQLAPKTDLYPGRTNVMWIQADRAGTYRGQCAEFCGLEHGLMIFSVVAQSPARFQQWAAQEARPAPAQTPGSALARGQQVFESEPCAGCHTIRGTTANGTIGPDLTHVGSRLTIGAGAVPNTVGNMAGWVSDAQSIKPGILMPPVGLSAADLQALVGYLESLK